MQIPQVVDAYFAADRRHDGPALARLFAPDASVQDEGRRHDGVPAIAAWWQATKAKYAFEVEPLAAATDRDAVRVDARVTGTFPGSPLHCTYAFRLRGDRIEALEITA